MNAHLARHRRVLALRPAAFAVLVVGSLAWAGCAGSDPPGTADAPPIATDAAPADPAAPAPADPADPAAAAGDPAAQKPAELTRMAKVVETKTAGGYTYARMDACGQEAWVAGPPTDLKAGATVTMPMGTAMKDFKAPGMGRTFDLILFVDWFKPVEGEPPPCPDAAAASGHGAGAEGAREARFLAIVTQTLKSGGYTYAELDRCGKKEWIAGPGIPTKVGDTLSVPEGAVMSNFEAKSLGRTFEAIRFVQSFAISPTKPDCK
jgi:hypothetical protein